MSEAVCIGIMRFFVLVLSLNPAFWGALLLFWIFSGGEITPADWWDLLWNP